MKIAVFPKSVPDICCILENSVLSPFTKTSIKLSVSELTLNTALPDDSNINISGLPESKITRCLWTSGLYFM